MRLVLGTHHLASIGGSETYLVTLARHLGRLGHDVTVQATHQGEMAEVATAGGLRVAADESELPDAPGALISQHAGNALELAQRYPGVPLLFVTHGIAFDCMLPPQAAGLVSAVIALNGRTARRVKAAACSPPVVRLRQPIELDRFSPRGPLAERPRRALLLGNNLRGERRGQLGQVLESLDIEVRAVGAHGDCATPAPEALMGDADVVIGYGRSVLEGMACGRAAFVYDHVGGDGWVTPDNYPAIEDNGFAGGAFEDVFDEQRLFRELRAYDPRMGLVNRELARQHHDALRHAVEVSELLAELAPGAVAGDRPEEELARFARNQWQSDSLAATLSTEALELRERLRVAERSLHEAHLELDQRTAQIERLKATRRYRAATALTKPLDRLRASRGS